MTIDNYFWAIICVFDHMTALNRSRSTCFALLYENWYRLIIHQFGDSSEIERLRSNEPVHIENKWLLIVHSHRLFKPQKIDFRIESYDLMDSLYKRMMTLAQLIGTSEKKGDGRPHFINAQCP